MKKIAVFNDISGFGKCSLAVSLPIISACGVQCCPLPTAVFTRQTAFDGYKFLELTDLIPSFFADWEREEFQGIYTGFFTEEKQIHLAKLFIEKHTEAKCVLVDPVMGDNGIAYPVCTAEILSSMKELIKFATVITPNLTELSMLTETDYDLLRNDGFNAIINSARTLLGDTLKTVIVTGVHKRNKVYNLIVTEKSCDIVASHMFYGSFSGTGDIFASCVSAIMVKGKSAKYAVKKAVNLISKSANATLKSNTDSRYGIEFEKYLDLLK